MGLSDLARHFCAGMLHHLPAIAAITAPSPVSYLRLIPNRWAPTAIDIGQQDRGAALRVCPVFAANSPEETARQTHVEFRVSDGSACPHMALGAVLFAGADGLRRSLPLPEAGARPNAAAVIVRGAGWHGAERGGAELVRPVFLDAYLRHKRSELQHVAGLDDAELCARYAEVY